MTIPPIALNAGAWLWQRYSTILVARAHSGVKNRWEKFKWEAAAESYRNKVKKLQGKMHILGMAQAVPIDNIFTDLYLRDRPTAHARFGLEEIRAASQRFMKDHQASFGRRFPFGLGRSLDSDTEAHAKPQLEQSVVQVHSRTPEFDIPSKVIRYNGLQLVVEKGKQKESEQSKIGRALRIQDARIKGRLQTLFHLERPPNILPDLGSSRILAGNLFILGKPGAGKTTFLKYLAIKAADETIDRVPILISLKEWADSSLDLWPFILQIFDICDFPEASAFVEELLRSGKAIVLFDGLDEVNQSAGERDKQVRAITNFARKFDHAQCLITCRIAADDYTFEGFEYVEIADFSPAQMETFARNWFRDTEGERDEKTSDKFLREFNKVENKGLRDLARTPLLLTLLCVAFNETLSFPQRRAEIYQEAVEALLKKWDASRRIQRDEIYRTLSVAHKENMLARIAAATFENNDYYISQSELETRIVKYMQSVPLSRKHQTFDGETILKAMVAQHGLFVERAHKIFSFSHLTVQEFFTAKYIVSNRKVNLWSLLSKCCADDRWREVLLLTASLYPDATHFITTFRAAVDEMSKHDKELSKLLSWAEKQSQGAREPWRSRLTLLAERLSQHETASLSRYMRVVLLLKGCMDLAVLDRDTRQEILDKLFCPADG